MAGRGAPRPARATEPAEIAYREPADLAVVRDFVRVAARDLGLPGSRADLLMIAVSELTTNTLQHTGAGGRVRVWADAGRLWCEVIDRGPAMSFGREMPAAHEPRGRGLPIVERICDEVQVAQGADGTHIRLAMAL
jgi:serine/threonine-protein kinase RsbW